MQGEFRWRFAYYLVNQPAVDADPVAIGRHIGARRLENGFCFAAEDVETDLLQHPERGLMDRLKLVGRDHIDRFVRIARLPPDWLFDRR